MQDASACLNRLARHIYVDNAPVMQHDAACIAGKRMDVDFGNLEA